MNNTLTSQNQQNNIQTVQLMDPSSTVNSVLNQYGYNLSYGDTERLKNLQPGQTMTAFATGNRFGALLEVTYHGNGTYTIKSTTPLNVNNQWVDINQTVTSPTATITYSNNNIQAIATTGYSTTGNIYLRESGTPNSTTLATYNVNVSVPVTHQITNNEIKFSAGTPQVTTNLQSINVPTITSQQLQNNNLQPGWYYNPETNEFIKLEYKTITQPVQLQTFGYSSLPENKLWFGYSSASITNNQNVVNQPKILQYSFFDPSLINKISESIISPNTNIYNYQTNYNNLQFPTYENLAKAYQTIQNWYADRYKEYIQNMQTTTMPEPKISIISPYSISEAFRYLYYKQLTQQIHNNPYYPYNPPKSPYFNLTNVPYIGHTTATFEQMNAINTINQIKNVERGIETYNLLSNIYSTLGLKEQAQYYQNLAQKAQIYGSPEFYQAEELGKNIRLTETAIAASIPFTIVGGVGVSSAGAFLRSAAPVARELAKEYAKNTAGITLANLAISEAYSKVTTGKDLTPEQIKQIVGESIVFGTTFTTIGKGLSLASQPVLSTIIKPQTSANVAILGKSLYDVGSGFTSTFGASLASQGFGKAMGWRKDINIDEALATASLAGGAISAIRGIQVLRAAKTGDYSVFATRIIPEKTEDIGVTPHIFIKDGQIITQVSGKAIGHPQIGQKILTQKDISNIKPVEYTYLITERLTPTQIAQTMEGNVLRTNIIYEGEQIAQAGVKRTIGKIKGEVESIFTPTENIDFEKYQSWVQANIKYLSGKYPEFNQLQNVPKESLQLLKHILEGKPIKAIKNPNVETINVYYPLSEFQTGNVNFNKNIAGVITIRSKGGISLPGNEYYEFLKEGIGLSYFVEGNKNQLAQIVTTTGVMRNQYGKGWVDVQQYISTGSPEKGFNILGYGRSVDPNIKELALTESVENIPKTNNIRNLQIGDQKQVLAYSTGRVVPPYYNPKAPPAFGMPSLNIINVNQQLLPNMENIIKPQVDLEKLKERFTQNIPRVDMVQTIQNIQQRITLPFQGLQSLQLNRVRSQDLMISQQRIIPRDTIVTRDVTTATLTIPVTNIGLKTIRIEPPPPRIPMPPPVEPRLVPMPPSPPKPTFIPPFLPPVIPRIGPSMPSPPVPMGRAKRVELDIVYTFNRLWR
jgi:hypothetical protein